MMRRLLALLILLLVGVAALYAWKIRPSILSAPELGDLGERLDEAKTTASVKAALALDRTTKGLDVRVSTEGGIVTLRGRVPDEDATRRVEQTVRSIGGVRQVVNHLDVVGAVPPKPVDPNRRSLGETLDDRALEVRVRLALSLRRELAGAEISVAALRREVTLAGTLAAESQRRIAVDTAGRTDGVDQVTDHLESTSGAGGPIDAAARRRAERAISDNPNLAPLGLSVGVESGRLVLRGRVRTGAERDLAGLLAQEAARVPVENALQIAPR